jgi:hypothetical protein
VSANIKNNFPLMQIFFGKKLIENFRDYKANKTIKLSRT